MSSPRASESTLRVRYAETDKMGVVYHANYFVWFEVGRTDLLRHAGWTYREMEAEGVSLPVIEAHAEYKHPARYDDELEIRVEASMPSPARLRFSYQVVRVADEAADRVAWFIRALHALEEGRPRPTEPDGAAIAMPAPGSADHSAAVDPGNRLPVPHPGRTSPGEAPAEPAP